MASNNIQTSGFSIAKHIFHQFSETEKWVVDYGSNED